MAWYNDVWDYAKENALELAKLGAGGAKAYIDYKDQKRRNEIEEAAYRDYMANVEAAGREAQAAIDLNLMPMEIKNVPTTKADVSDFTAVAAKGGLMNLPTRQRKRYYSGTGPEDIEIMDPESLGDFELQKEEGVQIGPMAAFPDTGDPLSNAQQVWQSGAIDQGIYQMDFNIFFQSGDWMDYISKEEVQGDMQMASSDMGDPMDNADEHSMRMFNGKKYNELTPIEIEIFEEEMLRLQNKFMATGGIAGLRHGGRPGYSIGEIVEDKETILETPNKEIVTNDMEEIQGQTAGGGARGWKAQEIAMDWAWDRYGKEFYDLSDAIQMQLYSEALDFVDSGGMKKGGRVKRAPGGIMNLGGLEKDYRTTGGFVPIGAYEKKDDVPARLSKNEFVMTADAVRAAGGGSINKGAQRMYDTMKHLEASPGSKRMTA